MGEQSASEKSTEGLTYLLKSSTVHVDHFGYLQVIKCSYFLGRLLFHVNAVEDVAEGSLQIGFRHSHFKVARFQFGIVQYIIYNRQEQIAARGNHAHAFLEHGSQLSLLEQ